MTIREVIANITTGVKEQMADSVLFNKYVYSVAFRKALFLIKRDADQMRHIYNQSGIWETISIDMEEVDAVECGCIPFPTGLTMYRSKQPLPEIIETAYGFLFQSISTPDNSITYRYTTPSQYVTRKRLKTFNPTKYFFIEKDYLWTPNAEYPCIKVTGLFNTLHSGQCSMLDKPFPCPGYLLDPVTTLAIQELLSGKQIPFDNIENKDSTNKTLQ